MTLTAAVPVPAAQAATLSGSSPTRRPVALEANATLVEREDLTTTIARLRFHLDRGRPPFRAGQYFAIGLPVGGRFVQRPYSTASAPRGGRDLEFLVRLVPAGSFTPLLWRLQPGDRVRVGPPKGLFTLDAGDPRRHVFLSTGTGIAPFLSMLGSLLEARATGSAAPGAFTPPIVVHGVATVRELAYRDRLERLDRRGAIVYLPAISRPDDPANAGWRGHTGRLDSLIGRIAKRVSLHPAATVAYVCGNPAMIAAVEPRLVGLGIPPSAIRAEEYWAPADRALAAPDAAGTRSISAGRP